VHVSTWLLVMVLVACLLFALWVVVRNQDDTADVERVAGFSPVPHAEAQVCRRYLARHRWHRRIGGTFGAVLALVVSARWYGTIGVGLTTTALADPLSMGIAGVVVGALSAELYRIRLPRGGAGRAASLAPRPELPGRRRVTAARTLVGVALALAVVRLIGADDAGPLLLVLAAGVLLVVADLTRSAVRHRPRPALSERAAVLDAGIRRFAADTVAWLEACVAVLALTWAITAFFPEPPAESGVLSVLTLGGLVAAVVLLVKAAPRATRAQRAAVRARRRQPVEAPA
jgi:hypothetical protein